MNPHDIRTFQNLHVEDVERHLIHTGWQVQSKQNPMAVEWQKEGDVILLITNTQSREYALRMSELVDTLARQRGRCKVDVIRCMERLRVRHPRSDDSVLVPPELLALLAGVGWTDLDGSLAEWGIYEDLEATRQCLRYDAVMCALAKIKDRAESRLFTEHSDILSIYALVQDLTSQLEELPFRRVD